MRVTHSLLELPGISVNTNGKEEIPEPVREFAFMTLSVLQFRSKFGQDYFSTSNFLFITSLSDFSIIL